MKIIVASFQCESNSKAKLHPGIEDFEYFKGDDIFKKLVVKDIFEKNPIEKTLNYEGKMEEDVYYGEFVLARACEEDGYTEWV